MCDKRYNTQTEEIGKFEAVIAGKPIIVTPARAAWPPPRTALVRPAGCGWRGRSAGTAAVRRRARRQ
ncbi:hypothetical protein GCM10017752_11460 [Streptomyces roseoviridis]